MFRDAVIAILATVAKQEHARLSERLSRDCDERSGRGRCLAVGASSSSTARRSVPCALPVTRRGHRVTGWYLEGPLNGREPKRGAMRKCPKHHIDLVSFCPACWGSAR